MEHMRGGTRQAQLCSKHDLRAYGMPAELSSDPATIDLDWEDGWCRQVPPGDNRNRRLPHRTRVSALSPESWREGNSRQTSRRDSQRSSTTAQRSHAKSAQSSRNERANTKHPEPEVLDDDEVTAFVLSEVLKALRLHPEARTAVREYFNALEDQLEREWHQQLESEERDAE